MAKRSEVAQAAESRYWREAEARVLVEAWRRSGETLTRFARRHGVQRRRLARWVDRLEGAPGKAVRFHRVRLVDYRQVDPERDRSGAAIEIQFGGGRLVRVPHGFEADELRRVLAVLAEVTEC
jgi:hypothetical protein